MSTSVIMLTPKKVYVPPNTHIDIVLQTIDELYDEESEDSQCSCCSCVDEQQEHKEQNKKTIGTQSDVQYTDYIQEEWIVVKDKNC